MNQLLPRYCFSKRLVGCLPVLLMMILTALVAQAVPVAQAATITVTNTADSGAGSLRQAILDAAPGDTIDFDINTLPGTVTLTSGELIIDKDITITGPGMDSLSISGNNSSRVFSIGAVIVTISDLTIRDGFIDGVITTQGGGILNHGTLTLTRTNVSNNRTPLLFSAFFTDQGEGGGVWNDGTLNIRESTVSDNRVEGESFGRGGGIYNLGGTVNLSNSNISRNRANGTGFNEDGIGGGICNNSGMVTLNNCIVNSNSTEGVEALGSGIWNNGVLTLTNCTVSFNGGIGLDENLASGGGIYNKSGVATITSCTINGNGASLDGIGGGIFNRDTMVIINSTMGGNRASGSDSGGQGGGMANDTTGIVTISNCLIANNTASGTDSFFGASKGGGIWNQGTMILTNSTVTGSLASMTYEGDAEGGGILNDGELTLNYCTIGNNSVSGGLYGDGRGGGILNNGAVHLKSTLIALNTVNAGRSGFGPDCFNGGTINSLGYNLIGDDTDCAFAHNTGDLVGTGASPIDPLLGPLQDNGGPTHTHALLSGSPAIDSADPMCTDADGNPVTTDQRGFARPADGDGDLTATCDMGAYEYLLFITPTPTPEITPTPSPEPSPTPTPAPCPCPGAQACYTLDEGSGHVAGDSSGNGHDGNIIGATWTTGKSGSGLSFDGVDDEVSIPVMNSKKVSVCAWFYKHAHDPLGFDFIFSGLRTSAHPQLREGFGLKFFRSNPNRVGFVVVTQNKAGQRTQRTASYDLGNAVGSWYHVAGTYNKSTGEQKLYVNGQLVRTVRHPAGNTIVPLTSYPDMKIGKSFLNRGCFNGIIDGVCIFDRPLNNQEVLNIFNN